MKKDEKSAHPRCLVTLSGCDLPEPDDRTTWSALACGVASNDLFVGQPPLRLRAAGHLIFALASGRAELEKPPSQQ